MAQSLANLLALLRKMFAWERLPEPPIDEPPPRRPARPGALQLLFGAETLPEDPSGRPADRPGLLHALFGAEELREDPVPAPDGKPGFLSLVLGRESLPEDPPGPPRRRGRWASWLFSPERIDPK